MDISRSVSRLVKISVARDEMGPPSGATLGRTSSRLVRSMIPSLSYTGASALPYSFEVYVRAADAKRARWILGLHSSSEEQGE
jgi:hypothetical protein